MYYQFSGFKLDAEKKELFYNDKLLVITKKNYDLLVCFVESAGIALSKDDLINIVWNGRSVADNTVDQSVYKLKKLLNSYCDDKIIETVYGFGVKFLPKVEKLSNQDINKKLGIPLLASNKNLPIGLIILGISVSILALLFNTMFEDSDTHAPIEFNNHVSLEDKMTPLPSVLVMTTRVNEKGKSWLELSPSLFVENILDLSNKVELKKFDDKPKNLNTKEYLTNQWNLNSDLKVITTMVTILDNQFTVLFSIINKQQKITEEAFTSHNLNLAFTDGAKWLSNQLEIDTLSSSINSFIPKDPYLLEMYLHGISAVKNEDIESATNFFEICLKQNPNYHIARLELAQLRNRSGNIEQALSLLDTISLLSTNTALIIKAETLRGNILLRQGKPKESGKIFLDLLEKHSINEYPNLIYTKYNLSLFYRATSRNDLALEEINKLESLIAETNLHVLRSNIYINKAGIFLLLGKNEEAQNYVIKSLEIYEQLGNLIGLAKAHSLYARVARFQYNYNEAEDQLNQALAISRRLDYSFGIGANLNELINLLIAQGKLKKAWKANQEMAQIANKISFVAMQLAAKQLAIEIAMAQKQWGSIDFLLKEHKELALLSNNKKALFQNNLLTLDINLSQGQSNHALTFINLLQEHITSTEETSKQPLLNLQVARYHFLKDNSDKALEVLHASLALVKKTEDNQALIHINNLLAKYYLEVNQPNKALAALEESQQFHPVAHPYLLLKSLAHFQLNNFVKALEFATLCKHESHDLWEVVDEYYLETIVAKQKDISS